MRGTSVSLWAIRSAVLGEEEIRGGGPGVRPVARSRAGEGVEVLGYGAARRLELVQVSPLWELTVPVIDGIAVTPLTEK
ncbi:hypothetical protein [Streptomyces sp. NPDC087859]|uniref:hypothetical protein n=1 Tax=Streptomyces sp. NPDC087859 TaxID=3365812 RepID=UPI00381BA60F